MPISELLFSKARATSAQPSCSPQTPRNGDHRSATRFPTTSAAMRYSSRCGLKLTSFYTLQPSVVYRSHARLPAAFSTFTTRLHRAPRQASLYPSASQRLNLPIMLQSRSASSSSSSATASPKKKAAPSPPRPSSSILLLSPTNEVLLLHRVQTSSSFPSAHVFPGGNCESFHDGEIPDAEDASGGRHADGPAYRWAGVRECFEESGILLAKREGEDRLAKVDEEERERARRDVHAGKRRFGDVLKEWDVKADIGEFGQPLNMARLYTSP